MLIQFAQVAALITVLGAAIYVIGLIALCWPIYRSLTEDASTAVFAASVVPRTVVAAQGVRIFVGFPLIAALCLLATVSMARWEPAIFGRVSEWVSGASLEEIHVLHQVTLAIIATLVALLFIGTVKRLRTAGLFDFFFSPLTEPDASPFKGLPLALSAIGGAIGGGLILVADQVSLETMFLALAVFFGAIALSSVPDATSIEPPLPRVKVTEKSETGEENYEGKLLAHSEGHWYVFDDEKNILHMIPDSNANVVCMPARPS